MRILTNLLLQKKDLSTLNEAPIMISENYKYKGGRVILTPTDHNCAWQALYNNQILLQGTEHTKSSAKRLCEGTITSFLATGNIPKHKLHKPHYQSPSVPPVPFKPPNVSWPCPAAQQWPVGSPQRDRHIDYCDECLRREIRMDKRIHPRAKTEYRSGIKLDPKRRQKVIDSEE